MLSLLYLPQTGSDHSFSAGMTLGNTAKKKSGEECVEEAV